MMKLRLAFVGSLLGMLMLSALAQQGAAHLLSADELKKVVPSEFFYRGQKAPRRFAIPWGFSLRTAR